MPQHEQQDDRTKQHKKKTDMEPLHMSFALSAHEGSVRALCITTHPSTEQTISSPSPGQLISAGYDESLRVLDLHQHVEVGEARTPSELGTPLCISLAPPTGAPTHALVGTSSGKIAIYALTNPSSSSQKRTKNNDDNWRIVHVLSGHAHGTGGVCCIATHPSGKLALSGGRDSTIRVWDLARGRLAHVHKLSRPTEPPSTNKAPRRIEVTNLLWSADGSRFAFSYESHITVRDMLTGEDLLDVELDGKAQKVNAMCFIGQDDAPEGLFLAAVCEDGSLPVFCVGVLDQEEDSGVEEQAQGAPTIRAIRAIEGVDRIVVGEDRLKCIRPVRGGSGYLVATANTGGVVSIIDLEGAVRMLISDVSSSGGAGSKDDKDGSVENDSEEEEEELAAEILTSVRVGSGARITDLAVWSFQQPKSEDTDEEEREHDIVDDDIDELAEEEEEESDSDTEVKASQKETTSANKRKREGGANTRTLEIDEEALARARKLVHQAKNRQRKEKKKKSKE